MSYTYSERFHVSTRRFYNTSPTLNRVKGRRKVLRNGSVLKLEKEEESVCAPREKR